MKLSEIEEMTRDPLQMMVMRRVNAGTAEAQRLDKLLADEPEKYAGHKVVWRFRSGVGAWPYLESGT